MKKVFVIIVIIAIIIIGTIFITNFIMKQNYERKLENIELELSLNEALYNNIATAVKKIDNVDAFYYTTTHGVTTKDNIDSNIIEEVNLACKAIKNTPDKIYFFKGNVQLSYTVQRGLFNDYMQITLTYYDELPDEINGEVINDHWIITIYGLV